MLSEGQLTNEKRKLATSDVYGNSEYSAFIGDISLQRPLMEHHGGTGLDWLRYKGGIHFRCNSL